jgi:hypothetical protein
MKKKASMFVFAALLLAVGTASLSADSFYQLQLRANIPFGFMVGSEVFPAGVYNVARVGNDASVLAIRSSDGRKSAWFLTFGTSSPEAREEASLVFNRYGDQYFLKEVWTVGDVTGRQLFPSRGERELSSAMIDATPDVVAIAAAR